VMQYEYTTRASSTSAWMLGHQSPSFHGTSQVEPSQSIRDTFWLVPGKIAAP
jgi:hypothetical protein